MKRFASLGPNEKFATLDNLMTPGLSPFTEEAVDETPLEPDMVDKPTLLDKLSHLRLPCCTSFHIMGLTPTAPLLHGVESHHHLHWIGLELRVAERFSPASLFPWVDWTSDPSPHPWL